jgi:hypothetical protein
MRSSLGWCTTTLGSQAGSSTSRAALWVINSSRTARVNQGVTMLTPGPYAAEAPGDPDCSLFSAVGSSPTWMTPSR